MMPRISSLFVEWGILGFYFRSRCAGFSGAGAREPGPAGERASQERMAEWNPVQPAGPKVLRGGLRV